MGYPTPPLPSDIKSEEQLAEYNAPSSELLEKVSTAYGGEQVLTTPFHRFNWRSSSSSC